MWLTLDKGPIMPPRCKKLIHKPQTLRKREPDELEFAHKLRRVGTSLKCSKCKKYGRNQRTCTIKRKVLVGTTIKARPSKGQAIVTTRKGKKAAARNQS